MSNDEIRIAIAEELGWDFEKSDINHGLSFVKGEKGTLRCGIHNYPEDLNACHEIENTLDEESYRLFIGHLVSILKPGQFAVRATALERSTAYLNLKGKWKEDAK